MVQAMQHGNNQKRIISGLAHCRHLKTVRTHLSGLVYHTAVSEDSPVDGKIGLTTEMWSKLCQNGIVSNSNEEIGFKLTLNKIKCLICHPSMNFL